MRTISIILFISVIMLCPISGMTYEDADIKDARVYETEHLRFIVPGGWSANEIEPEIFADLQSFNRKLLSPSIGVVAGNDAAGLMILMSGRKDNGNTFFDYMLLKQWSKLEIYKLFEGDYAFADKTGKERKCTLAINAVDDGKSIVLMSHNIVIFTGGKRYEFVYIADADEYAANFKYVEMIFSSMEFM